MHLLKKISLIISIITFLFFYFSCEKPEREAKVETGQVTDIMATSAKVAGEIIDVGEGITEHGHCWGFSTQPTISDLKTILGSTDVIGNYTSELLDLELEKLYYVRAYAITGSDVVYGKAQQFITQDGSAQVITTEITDTTINSAKSGGNILSVNGDEIIGRGVCWDTVQNFILSDCIGYTEDSLGLGSFNSELMNLMPGETYRVKAYAITNVDTSYGEPVTFSTLSGIATLTTADISNIRATSATSGGSITDDGGAEIISRGVCWNLVGNPSINDSLTTDESDTGNFTSQLTNLQVDTTYYVRAYATTDYGTGYGNEISFLTKGLPELNTTAVTDITDTSAVCGGEVYNDWGFTITASGVCWNTIGNPTLENNEGYTVDGSGTSNFTSNLTGLTKGTTYYVRAYAKNSVGTAYGLGKIFETTRTFVCRTSTIIDYDGNEYHTAQIGSQCWMRENLKTTHYFDGTPLIDGTSAGDITGNYTTKYWFVYEDNLAKKDTYGLLYTWAAVMNGATSSDAIPSGVQGVCPDGWHLPSDREWKELEMFLGMSQAEADSTSWRGTNEGGKLKETGTTHWNSPNTGATNSGGFTALPSGNRDRDGIFFNMGYFAYFWSSAEYSSYPAWYRSLDYNSSEVRRNGVWKEFGFSVRCIKDE